MADSIGGDMIRGHIDSIILNSLLDGDKDTKQIRTEIESKAGGGFKLKQGTLYSSLQRISSQGFVTEYRTSGSDGVRRKFFQLTENGKAHIEKSQSTWSQSQSVINKLLDSEQSDSSDSTFSNKTEDIRIPSFDTQPTVVSDFSAYSEQMVEHAVTNEIVYDDDDSEETVIQDGAASKITSTDEEVNGLLSILDSQETDDKKDDEKETVTTYTYFETSVDKNASVATSLLVENSSTTVEKNFVKTPFDTYVAGYESDTQYNSDISTDAFVADDDAVLVTEDNSSDSTTTLVETTEIKQADLITDIDETESITEEAQRVEVIETTATQTFVQGDAVKQEGVVGFDEHITQANLQGVTTETDALQDNSIPGSVKAEKRGKPVYKQITIEETVDITDGEEIDDFIASADDIPDKAYPDQPSYRDILSRLLENNDRKQEENTKKVTITPLLRTKSGIDVQIDEDDQSDSEVIQTDIETGEYDYSEENDKVVEFPGKEDDVAVDDIYETDNDSFLSQESGAATFEKTVTSEKNYNRTKTEQRRRGSFDYSDIISLSEEEGFKVSTADRTNKSELGRILINKLNFHTALIFFVVILAETLVVGFTMNGVLQFPLLAYIIFDGIILLFPIITGVAYFVSPRRAINEIRPFRSAFETALIITIETLIAVLVLSVIFNVDFTVYAEVARTLLTPILVLINIPLYVIIRYALLDKQMYYS